MNKSVAALLEGYPLSTQEDFTNALREVLQHLALLGLWRSRFFEQAAFYGGTALRIFYGIERFSEDLDFSLAVPNKQFNLLPYLRALEEELASQGFSVSVEKSTRTGKTAIESGFVKADTRANFLIIDAPARIVERLHREQRLRIKIEVDVDPPPGAQYEVKTVLRPIPFQVKLYSGPDLFAGKLHALLCRQWKSRVKGRDFYDFVWFIGSKIPCRLSHLQARMEQTGHWKAPTTLERDALVRLLIEKFATADIAAVRDEVRPFIRDPDSLALWNREFFLSLAKQVETV
jgi:predicted nucleotidyltransferase component of viral defense system